MRYALNLGIHNVWAYLRVRLGAAAGPIRRYSSMRPEGNHGRIKEHMTKFAAEQTDMLASGES